MSLWEYRKIMLNQLSAKTNDVDVLNDAGDEGWELVAILANNIAYLKRQVGESVPEATARGAASLPKDTNRNGNGPAAGSGYRAPVKYRDPEAARMLEEPVKPVHAPAGLRSSARASARAVL